MAIYIHKSHRNRRPFAHAPRQLQKSPDLSLARIEFQLLQGSSTLVDVSNGQTSSVIGESTLNHLPALVDVGNFSKRPFDGA